MGYLCLAFPRAFHADEDRFEAAFGVAGFQSLTIRQTEHYLHSSLLYLHGATKAEMDDIAFLPRTSH